MYSRLSSVVYIFSLVGSLCVYLFVYPVHSLGSGLYKTGRCQDVNMHRDVDMYRDMNMYVIEYA